MIDQHILTRPRRLQWRMAIGWAILSLGMVVWGLIRMHLDRTPTLEAGQANLESLKPWWMASASTWAALTVMGWMLFRGRIRHPRESFGRIAMTIFLVAVAARAAVIIGHEPALSDDIYRYVLDGRNLAHGHNPYLNTPAERAGFHPEGLLERPLSVLMDEVDPDAIEERWPGEAQLLPLINNPEMHTIYLPTSQWVFAALGRIVREPWSDPATSERIFRIGIVGFEMIAILGLLFTLATARRSAWWAALYAWHPLPLSELAGAGHQDSIGIALMMLAFVFFLLTPRRIWMWTAALALAALVKPMVLPVAAFMLKDLSLRRFHRGGHGATRSGMHSGTAGSTVRGPRCSPRCIVNANLKNWNAWLMSALIGATICFAISAPLWLTHDRQPLKNLQATSNRFSMKWSHFGSVYESTLWTIRVFDPIEDLEIQWQKKERQEALARIVCLTLIALVCLVVFLCPVDAWQSSRAVLFAMVILSTTSHPWYLLWALILLPSVFSPAVWIASLTLPWGYAQLGDVVEWTTPAWVMWVAYVPIYAALFLQLSVRQIARKLEL